MRRIASLREIFHACPVLGAAALAVAAPAGSAAAADIEIDRVAVSGNGCPRGSYVADIDDEGQDFHLWFLNFHPEVTPKSSTASAECRLQIGVKVRSGRSFQIQSFSYLGYAYLEQGVSAELSTTYSFQDAASQTVSSTLKGPFDDVYEVEDKQNADGIWSPCSKSSSAVQTLNVQLTVKLTNSSPARDGTLELNEAVAAKLGWKSCS